MVEKQYDVVVLGGGPAGIEGAIWAADRGKHVAVVEAKPYLGGAGINTGTLPSKTLRETALAYYMLRHRGLYGINYSLKGDLSIADLMHREQIVVGAERELYAQALNQRDITWHRGRGHFENSHRIIVEPSDQEPLALNSEVVLIATGSRPRRVDNVPFDDINIFDSDTILEMDHIPDSLAIVGGGVIGTEYASLFAALGVDVTLVESKPRLLPFVDDDIVDRLQTDLRRLGLRFIFNERMKEISIADDRVQLVLTDGRELTTDSALLAAGRISNVESLNLEAAGVEVAERGLITVDDDYQTTAANVYAAGDVIGFPALASTSMEQARLAMAHAVDPASRHQLSRILPFAVYTIPEIAMVGCTEREAEEQHWRCAVAKADYRGNARAEIIGERDGLLKLVFDPTDGRLHGAHIIGELAAELIHIAVQVMECSGTIHTFRRSVFNYPTLSGLYKEAGLAGLRQMERERAQAGD